MTCDGISRPASIDIPGFLRIPKNSRHLLNFGNTKPCCTKITSCRRVSCGHIAQVAFLPLEFWGESPLSPRGVPIIGPRKLMHASAVLFTIPNQGFRKGLLHCSKSNDEIPFPGFIKSQKSGPAVMITLCNTKNYPESCKHFGTQHKYPPLSNS